MVIKNYKFTENSLKMQRGRNVVCHYTHAMIFHTPEIIAMCVPTSHVHMFCILNKQIRTVMKNAECATSLHLPLRCQIKPREVVEYMQKTLPNCITSEVIIELPQYGNVHLVEKQMDKMHQIYEEGGKNFYGQIQTLNISVDIVLNAVIVRLMQKSMVSALTTLKLDGTPYDTMLVYPANRLHLLKEFSWSHAGMDCTNAINVIHRMIASSEHIETLCLAHNEIETMHLVFDDLQFKELKNLDLSYNRIYWYSFAAFTCKSHNLKTMPNLKKLDLSFSSKLLQVTRAKSHTYQEFIAESLLNHILAKMPKLSKLRIAGYSPIFRRSLAHISNQLIFD